MKKVINICPDLKVIFTLLEIGVSVKMLQEIEEPMGMGTEVFNFPTTNARALALETELDRLLDCYKNSLVDKLPKDDLAFFSKFTYVTEPGTIDTYKVIDFVVRSLKY
jgi:hypothetical protein